MSVWLVDAVRRNHALEHATIALMRGRVGPETHVSGRSTPWGFHIYGDISTDLLKESAEEALARLRNGEVSLAVSDLCGTNLAVSGILAGLAAMIAVGRGRRLERLPQGILAALAAALIAPPLGRWVQRNVTTLPEVGTLRIIKVERQRRWSFTAHTVWTSAGE